MKADGLNEFDLDWPLYKIYIRNCNIARHSDGNVMTIYYHIKVGMMKETKE